MHMDLVVEKMTTGVRLHKRDWIGNGGCLVSHLDPYTPDSVQLADCDNHYQDYFELVDFDETRSSQLPNDLHRGSRKLVRALATEKCLGHTAGVLQLVDCTTAHVVYLVHNFQDDGGLETGPTVDLRQAAYSNSPERVIRYEKAGEVYQNASVTSTFTAREQRHSACDCDNVLRPEISLVDYSAQLLPAPSTHRYVVKVQRTTNSQELVLLRNGTVIDRRILDYRLCNMYKGKLFAPMSLRTVLNF